MNKVCLTGNLCKDPETRKTASGKSVVNVSVAVRRDFKEEGEYNTDFINLVAWGTQADYLANYAHKGDRVEATGRWQVRQYQDKEGNNRRADEMVVENIRVLSKRAQTDTPSAIDESSPTIDDLPF